MKELDRLLYGEQAKGKNLPTYGRVSNALGAMIAYDRTPSLFDPQEIIDRDIELMRLQALNAQDSILSIDRKGKPVYLSTKQNQLLCALTRYLNVEDEDVRLKMQNPFPKNKETNITISRPVSISDLSQWVNGSKRERCRRNIRKDLDAISNIRQIQIIEKEIDEKGRTFRVTAPLIHLDISIEELNAQNEEEAIDVVNVIFGGAFFYRLNERYFYVTPKCFEVWRKNGNQNELFSTLLMHLLTIYWQFYTASNNAEISIKKKIRDENKDSKTRTSKEDYTKRIRDAKRDALTCYLNFSSIKKKLSRDYDSNKQYRNRFKTDLKTAMDGLIETGLITEYRMIKGAKKQDMLEIVFSDSYNQSSKLLSNRGKSCKGNTPPLLSD